MKQKYNELGARVTNGKNDLEKAFKFAKKFRKEYNIITDFMSKIDGELRKIEKKPLSKNYTDELEWIKNTKNEINKVGTNNLETMRTLRKSLEELTKPKSPSIVPTKLPGTTVKINEVEQKVNDMLKRIEERATFLHDEIKKLDELYKIFLNNCKQVISQIDTLHHHLIEAERNESREDLDVI